MADTSPDAVTARLREASRLRRDRHDRRPAVDMSPDAISGRLRTAFRLSELCRRLGEAAPSETSSD